MQARCPWCGRSTAIAKKLCMNCYSRAVGAPSLSAEELNNLPFGIIELDAQGTIIGFNNAEERISCIKAVDVIGRNFFRDVAPCTRVKEYEGRFRNFLLSPARDEEFDFTYTFAEGSVEVHIIFVKVEGSCVVIASKEKVA